MFQRGLVQLRAVHLGPKGEERATHGRPFARALLAVAPDLTPVPADLWPLQGVHRARAQPCELPQYRLRLSEQAKGYRLHLITNGFEDVQVIKLTSSGLMEVITSEHSGYLKSDPRMFAHALARTSALAPRA